MTRSLKSYSKSFSPAHAPRMTAALLACGLAATISGCGTGGYAGGLLSTLSASVVAMDATQSFQVDATTQGTLPVQWTLSGDGCSGATCGTVQQPMGMSNIYTAPAQVAAPMNVTMQAAVAGTKSNKTVAITVNPAPAISGTLADGVVGTAYAAKLTSAGGTGKLTLTLKSGTLPAGLSFDAASGNITGTPTAVGSASFTVAVTDQAFTPYTSTASRTINITAAAIIPPPNNPPPPPPPPAGPALAISNGAPVDGTVAVPYAFTLAASGGTAPYTWTLASGQLPAGLTLLANGSIAGLPTVAGTRSFVVNVQDSTGASAQANLAITIHPAQLGLLIGVLAPGTVGVPYNQTITVGGGTAPYTCSLAGASMPAGLTLNANCSVTGTPTAAGLSTPIVRVTDSGSPAQVVTGPIAITIAPTHLGLLIGVLSPGTVGVSYSQTISIGGGTAPYTCSLAGASMPAGLTLNADCSVTGTPTAAGLSTPIVRVTDSGSPAQVVTGPVAITIAPTALNFTVTVLPNATVNHAYTATLSLAGGTAPYTCSLQSGVMPTGLTLNANCTITGTPTQIIAVAPLVIKGTDSSSPAQTTTAATVLTVLPLPLGISISVLPNGTVGVPYAATIAAGGGVAPYTCALAGGTLPDGLTLNANCSVTGTPTAAAIAALLVRVTDSNSPASTTTATVALTIVPSTLAFTLTSLHDGTVGVAYSATITGQGGTGPYSCSVASGSFPAGLTLHADCTVTGTPTQAGFDLPVVRMMDSAATPQSVNAAVAININPASLSFTISVLPNATVNSAYSATISLAGGTAPYTCQLVSGSVPAGLTLNANCTVTGTPTSPIAVAALVVKATDAGTPAQNTTATVVLTVTPLPLAISISVLPNGVVGTAYSATVAVGGGVAPYTCALVTGVMPAGLVLNADCSVSGTPTAVGIAALLVRATDSNTPAASSTAVVALTVTAGLPTLTITSPLNATVGTAYTGSIGVTGGTGPYTCTVTSGSLPAGLSLNNCSITGTPTTAATATLGMLVADAATPIIHNGVGNVTMTVLAAQPLAFTATLPAATLNAAYTTTMAATGGVAPYTYTVTAGTTLPAGLSLSTAGVLSGTPTAPGAASFTVTATDSQATAQTVNLPLLLMVSYPAGANNALLSGHYAFLFQGYDDVALGVLAYQTATVGSFSADGLGNINAGELDRNSQLSTSAHTTVDTNNLLGTYTVGADGRGTLAITTLNADGTAAGTSVMAIALKAAVNPATVSAEGSLITFDNDGLVGTKGSGTLLLQNTAAMTSGLAGSYAFGLSGDTPCLPTCTVGISAGPAATVGQFTASASVVTGIADANIAADIYVSSSLSGNYLPPDANGRVQLSMNNTLLNGKPYPVDYAAYVVDAGRVLLMSTDKHSNNVLQAGTATLQTISNFTAANSLNGAFVGYENAPVNPGIVGTLLSNTLNLGSATVFQAAGNGDGTCTTNAVDVGGLTGLVNTLTGFGSSNAVLSAVLGTAQSLGNSTCTLATNGRAVMNYPAPSGLLATTLALLGLGNAPPAPRVVYLSGANTGYFLETGYAGLGRIEAQSGSAFSNASLSGKFLYRTAPASSLVTIDSSGSFFADGAGNVNELLDANVGIGTVNVLHASLATSAAYAVTSAVNGRFLLGASRVIYAINAGRYVLLEASPLSTSPYIALLY